MWPFKKKERKIDERFNTEFENKSLDILYVDWSCLPYIAGEIIHIGQVVYEKDNKLYGATNNDIAIGIALYSGNAGDKIAVIHNGIVYGLASKNIKKGEFVRASKKYGINGLIEEIRCWDDEDAIGRSIEDIPKNQFGRIWLMTHEGGYRYWSKYIEEKND